MRRIILYIISSIILNACISLENEHLVYYFGDSHIARLDADWYFPDSKNVNLSVSGTRIEEIDSQYHHIYDTAAICIVEIGTNNMKHGANFNVDRNVLRNFLITAYADELSKLSEQFKETYMLSVFPVSLRYESDNIVELGKFYSVMNYSIDSLTNQFDNIFFIDVQSGLASSHPLFLDDDLTIDELHLNDMGYKVLAGIIKNEIFKQR